MATNFAVFCIETVSKAALETAAAKAALFYKNNTKRAWHNRTYVIEQIETIEGD
jgi:hypothetical protein